MKLTCRRGTAPTGSTPGMGVAVLLSAVFLLLAGTAVLAGPRATPLDRVLPAHPDRIIVKYRPAVGGCVQCLLAKGSSFGGVTGSDSLDRVRRQLGVRRARPLFFDRSNGGGSAAYFKRLARARARFPARAARAAVAGAPAPDLSNVYVLELEPGTDVARAAARYATDPAVEYAEPDYKVQALFTPDDPFFSSSGTWGQLYPDLWGLHTTQADLGWDVATGTGVVVAVVDTGVDYNHVDLAANMWANPGETPGDGIDNDGNGYVDDIHGWDFQQNDNDPLDDEGHGTHVAGIIAAVGNNGTGVVGMAWGAQVMAVKGLSRIGIGYVSDLAPAIVYAAENGADVINNSWGGFGISSTLVDAVDTARSLGAVVVAAAGNSATSADNFEPAGIPGVIAVGATESGDVHASFSNHGEALSVAAPGVDILSLRGSDSADVGGKVVEGDYLRLSGTSMASPHAAGLAAVLLSQVPGLSPEEVRWHLELNADQPGYPGYEGEVWNPYFGWGRINASQVFDPPPVTTRMQPRSIELQGFAGGSEPDASAVDLAFTTLDPVAWTVTTPSWLTPSPTSGSGPAHVGLSYDGSGLTAGAHSGAVTADAPGASDGGGSIAVDVYVHRDERVGTEFPVETDATYLTSGPRIASNGLESLVVWSHYTAWPPKLYAAVVDGAGVVTGPNVLADGFPHKYSLAVASDGRNFLVGWTEEQDNHHEVKALRVGPTGEAIDATPFVLDSRRLRDVSGFYGTEIAFDGDQYIVLWGIVNVETDVSKIYVRRVGVDGTLVSRKRRIYLGTGGLITQYITPKIACAAGSCLVAWQEADGELSPTQKYVDKVFALKLIGDEPVDRTAVQIIRDVDSLAGIATDGTDYFLLGSRINVCTGPVICGYDIVGARVTGELAALDPDGIRLNKDAPDPSSYRYAQSVVFDGTNYLAMFGSAAPTAPGGGPMGSYVFARHVAPDGTVLDTEPEGMLVNDGGTASAGITSAHPAHVLVAWRDSRLEDPSRGYFFYPSVYAQRVFGRTPGPHYPVVEIGAIGPRTVAEGAGLQLRLAASGLDPGAAVFSATNLPPGAVFDAANHLFRWQPASDEAGTYPGVHFEATDGVATVSEDVTVTVTEARLSISGMTRLADGTPVPGLALKLVGVRPRRKLFSGADGRFRVDVPAPGHYRLRLIRPSRRDYRTSPRVLKVAVAGSDVTGADIIVSPK